MTDTMIPLEAERAFLGAILADNTLPWPALCAAEDFGHPPHALIVAAMLSLHRQHAPVDHLTLADRLKEQGRLAEVGGPAYLMALDQSVPFASNLAAYAETVKDYAARRGLMATAKALADAAQNLARAPESVAVEATAALGRTRRKRVEESPDVDLTELSAQWSDFIDRMARGETDSLDDGVRLKTGIDLLDNENHAAGFVNNLNCLLGLASKGKTAIAAEIIWNWLRQGIPGAIIGLEDGTKWLTRRHLARHLGIDVKKVGRTLLHEYQYPLLADWMDSTSAMYRAHLRIHRAGGLHATDLLAMVRRWIEEPFPASKEGGKQRPIRWVWIDHGLRVDYSNHTPGVRERYDMAIGRTLDALATLGERHGVAICVNWHLNRVSEEDVRPTMSMAKESGYLEAAARQMLAVWEQKESRPGVSLVTGLKNTEGARDWTVALERDFEHGLVRSYGGYPVDFAAENQRLKDEAKEVRERQKGKKLFGGGG